MLLSSARADILVLSMHREVVSSAPLQVRLVEGGPRGLPTAQYGVSPYIYGKTEGMLSKLDGFEDGRSLFNQQYFPRWQFKDVRGRLQENRKVGGSASTVSRALGASPDLPRRLSPPNYPK